MFTPRTFEEIRDSMLAFVRLQTDLTDFEVGSVIRTIIEAAALEDDEQYFQMVQLLDAFRLSTASGSVLDGRVEEFGIIRLQPASSSGSIVIQDGVLVTSTLAFDITSASLTVQLENTSQFPTAGFPFTLRLGEGTVEVEDIAVSANNTVTNTLTTAATVNAHDAGDRASVVSGVADKILSPGIRVQVPAVGTEASIIYVSVESGTTINGNFDSTKIQVKAEVPGRNGNVGVNKIVEFISNPPFDGALVSNKTNTAGGRDLETDAQLRDRARSAIQSLSKGTVLALKEGVLGITDPVTGQRVTTANILESFVTDEVTVFVDDGTGFIPDQIQLARSSLSTGGPPLVIGSAVLTVTDASKFPEEGSVILSPEDVAETEVLAYSGVNQTLQQISLVATTTKVHDNGDEVALVDVIENSAEAGTNFFQLANFPVVKSSQRVWLASGVGGIPTLQGEPLNFSLNRGNGQLEFTGAGVAGGSQIVASYSFFIALLAQVQKVIEGDPDDPTTFPGLKAAGIKALTATPTVRRVTVRASITAQPGIQEADITSTVTEAIESYVNGLNIGDDVIVSEIIERAMGVNGMFDITVTLPLSNVVVLENELPRPFDVNGESLVTVT